jgi:hypothetical protein
MIEEDGRKIKHDSEFSQNIQFISTKKYVSINIAARLAKLTDFI